MRERRPQPEERQTCWFPAVAVAVVRPVKAHAAPGARPLPGSRSPGSPVGTPRPERARLRPRKQVGLVPSGRPAGQGALSWCGSHARPCPAPGELVGALLAYPGAKRPLPEEGSGHGSPFRCLSPSTEQPQCPPPRREGRRFLRVGLTLMATGGPATGSPRPPPGQVGSASRALDGDTGEKGPWVQSRAGLPTPGERPFRASHTLLPPRPALEACGPGPEWPSVEPRDVRKAGFAFF